MLTILLLFIQQHMTQLSIPFQCKSMADGSKTLVASQDIVCNLASKTAKRRVVFHLLIIPSVGTEVI